MYFQLSSESDWFIVSAEEIDVKISFRQMFDLHSIIIPIWTSWLEHMYAHLRLA